MTRRGAALVKHIPWPAVPPTLCTLVAAALLIAGVRAYDGFGSLATAGLVTAVTAVAGAGLVCAFSGAISAHRAGHGGEGELGEDACRHESGHVVAALHGAGAARVEAFVRPDGSGGVTVLRWRRKPTLVERVAFAVAGEIAEGSAVGSGTDRRIVNRLLRQAPPAERRAVLREGEQLARTLLSRHAGEARRIAEHLRRDGYYRN